MLNVKSSTSIAPNLSEWKQFSDQFSLPQAVLIMQKIYDLHCNSFSWLFDLLSLSLNLCGFIIASRKKTSKRFEIIAVQFTIAELLILCYKFCSRKILDENRKCIPASTCMHVHEWVIDKSGAVRKLLFNLRETAHRAFERTAKSHIVANPYVCSIFNNINTHTCLSCSEIHQSGSNKNV